jgi:hypothetical protein
VSIDTCDQRQSEALTFPAIYGLYVKTHLLTATTSDFGWFIGILDVASLTIPMGITPVWGLILPVATPVALQIGGDS